MLRLGAPRAWTRRRRFDKTEQIRGAGGRTVRYLSCCTSLLTTGAVQLPRKPNYDFEKRKKELDRKAKKDAKLRDKREQAARAREESEGPVDQDAPPQE